MACSLWSCTFSAPPYTPANQMKEILQRHASDLRHPSVQWTCAGIATTSTHLMDVAIEQVVEKMKMRR